MNKITLRTIFIVFLLFFVAYSCSTKDEVISYDLVTSVQPEEGGEVTPIEGNFISDTEVKITATATEGYFFKTWAGASLDSTNVINLRMDSDKQLTAIFEKLDMDGDGISDDLDECSDTPKGETVDAKGCSNSQKDTDGDGVTDDLDTCLNTPYGETIDSKGCSDSQKDTDDDGITDDLDQCQNTPDGETVDSRGCSETQVDTDGDTVTDDFDQCPNTPKGETVDSEGCSDSQKDTDGDGITDDLDQCDNTPNGETVDSRGCSETQVDTDGDTVSDDFDQCPNTLNGEAVDSQGCSYSQKDTDGDGITDDLDQCDNTPNGETVDPLGCSNTQTDTDNDGLADDLDTCPNTPDGEIVDSEGCSDSQKDSDGDGVFDDADQCIDTPNGETVDANGCSNSQVDNSAPEVINITISGITSTSFNVNWNLNEISKGYIQFGTSSGVYVASTAIENNFFDSHAQTIGGNNPFPLNSGTTYYWQIYVEDEYGNTGFSEEQTTTIAQEQSLTYVPDDAFEQYLIDSGYDDFMDDYVSTAILAEITTLSLNAWSVYGVSRRLITDFTGLQDFTSLQELVFSGMDELNSQNLDLTNNINLRKLTILDCSFFDGVDLSHNTLLEELIFRGDDGTCLTNVKNLDLINNQNLKTLKMFWAPVDNLNLVLSHAKSLENLIIGRLSDYNTYSLDLSNNINLRNLQIDDYLRLPEQINLRNGSNDKLESIIMSDWGVTSSHSVCLEVDNPIYVESILQISVNSGRTFNIVTDCND
ncbi:thrombospondin type 3 repeat-containing protein [Maribacter spongiicola]|uniref:Thrombospondin type 3 repeat-containing protein n=1 Tax=Maribacter spongiicola TaxID=1206753 RepID=A0A4R7K1P5_9FLAO|nr:thrombospondin type 3 repeat-containing protein [Maribacter spongiicola]TDT44770.1 thrombospondin type 3 repeat-containing protein [Maribacter spongiicola]